MEFSIRHFISGRIRLHLPSLCRKQKLAEAAVIWLQAQQGVKRARLNFTCACLVIEYDPSFESVLRATLGRLSLMGLDDLRLLFNPGNVPAEARPAPLPQPAARRSLWRRTPLGLPTVSLLMAFSANPVVAAINMPLMLWNAYPIALRAWRVWRREGRLNVDVLDTLAIAASLMQGNPMAGAIVTWLIKLGDWIRDLTAAGSSARSASSWNSKRSRPGSSATTSLLRYRPPSWWPATKWSSIRRDYSRRRRDHRRSRHDRSKDDHRRGLADHAGERRSGIRRNRHPRRSADGPRHPRRHLHDGRANRTTGRIRADRRYADAEPRREASPTGW